MGGRQEGSVIKDYVGKNEGWVRGVGVCKCIWSRYRNKRGEEFWVDLNECVESFGVNMNIIFLGDLNARVGDEHVVGITGKYGVPDMNWNGENCWRCVWREN